MFTEDKQVYEERISALKDRFAQSEEWLGLIGEAVYQYEKKTVRKMILKDHKRADGSEITQIRPLTTEIDIIPRVHSSAMFTRGQTQICNVCTLAPLSEAQRLDGLNKTETSKRYMHHYNFPFYFVYWYGFFHLRTNRVGEEQDDVYEVESIDEDYLNALGYELAEDNAHLYGTEQEEEIENQCIL